MGLPPPPVSNGFYRLQINSGIATWVTDTA